MSWQLQLRRRAVGGEEAQARVALEHRVLGGGVSHGSLLPVELHPDAATVRPRVHGGHRLHPAPLLLGRVVLDDGELCLPHGRLRRELVTLRKEREEVKGRVDKMLGQIDAIISSESK